MPLEGHTLVRLIAILITVIQVVLGAPTGLKQGFNAKFIARLAGVSSGNLARCPNQLSLFLAMILLHFDTPVNL